MDIEPLPKVTFLPAQLTELVIKNWTGDIIDYEKNGQICKVYHGQGTCQFRDGHQYKGELKHGLLHGKGRFDWTDGTQYKGEFKSNEITGVGRYQWPDGSTYEGQVKNGLRHGEGKYVNPKEGVEYIGEWLDGMRHGRGKLIYKNGSIYEGQWERGMKWGNGTMTYASGNYYEGDWANNKRNGQGCMNWKTSAEKYEGNWEDNFQSGFGAHIWLDGSTESKLLRNRYVGYWMLGQRHGKGTFYYSNGSKYEGEWKENFKHGRGVFTFEDGTQYIGPFENDRMLERDVPIKEAQHTSQQAHHDNKQDGQKKAGKSVDKPAKKTDAKKPDAGKKSTQGSALATGSSALGNTTGQSRFATSRAKKEVEENPFKKLIDISDLVELEESPKDSLKEVQNILLRHNSELKHWYRIYSRKIEAHKCEESFAMTLKQVWRFLRDTRLVSANSTLAQFDRVYNQGTKNHFTLLGSKDQEKFDVMYGVDKVAGENALNVAEEGAPVKVMNISDDEEEEDVNQGESGIEPEDSHDALKIVLQRQFFEAIARAAAVKYASGSEGVPSPGGGAPTLANKLDHLFNKNFKTLAIKNKSKTQDDEKAFKTADKVFDEYAGDLHTVFSYFSKRSGNLNNGRKDVTIEVKELLDMLRKAHILDGPNPDLQLEEVVHMIEKYYSPDQTLESKVDQGKFDAYIVANPMLLRVNQEAAAKAEKAEKARLEAEKRKLEAEEGEAPEEVPQEEQPEENEEEALDEEAAMARDEEELAKLNADWKNGILSAHLLYIKGVELVYHEFKELLLELALRLKDQVDAAPGKLRSLVKKFLDELFLKRLRPLIKFDMGHKVSGGSNGAPSLGTRSWPESQKDQTIKEIMEVRHKQEQEEQKKRDEEAKKQAALEAQKQAEWAALQSPEAIIEREKTAMRVAETDTAQKAASGGNPTQSAAEDDEDEEEDLDDLEDDEDEMYE